MSTFRTSGAMYVFIPPTAGSRRRGKQPLPALIFFCHEAHDSFETHSPQTPIHLAAICDAAPFIATFFRERSNANFNRRDRQGLTPLLLAVRQRNVAAADVGCRAVVRPL